MSIFNRIFRTKSHISRVEICKYKLRYGLAPEEGVEIQIHHVVRGRNISIILPLSVMKQLPQFWDESNRFSRDLLSGCNILLEVQKPSLYTKKKADIEKKKKELAEIGVKGRVGEAELAKAQKLLKERIGKEEKLKRELALKQMEIKKKRYK